MAYNPFDLNNHVALVTGGNGGIGLGMADALAQAGATLVIWGTNEQKNTKASEQLSAHGGEVVAELVDVSDPDAVAAGVQRIVEKYQRLDSAFANSGISGGGAASMFEIDPKKYRRVMEVNLDGVFYTFRETARQMMQQPEGGSLIGVASVAAIEGAARAQHYAASKGGVISMVKATAVELARHKIRCNAILPGWIRSEMTQAAQDNEVFNDKVIPRVPMKRWGNPEDFGGIAVYLASSASRYHTGTTSVVDGGYTIF